MDRVSVGDGVFPATQPLSAIVAHHARCMENASCVTKNVVALAQLALTSLAHRRLCFPHALWGRAARAVNRFPLDIAVFTICERLFADGTDEALLVVFLPKNLHVFPVPHWLPTPCTWSVSHFRFKTRTSNENINENNEKKNRNIS
jgi:hypothetical protein